MHALLRLAIASVVFGVSICSVRAGSAEVAVNLARTPNGGIQPQALVDIQGTVHLVYFHGDAKAGDIFYVRKGAASKDFSQPLRVNSEPGSATAIGTIRGAQFALGRNGRVHVAWNGSKPSTQHIGSAMFYTRLSDSRNAFEPQRDLITTAAGLDGGGSVAADGDGRVYVMWHAPKPGNTQGEAGRAVFVARSSDDGHSFAPEIPALPNETGACACCSMRAFVDRRGNVFALYRAAQNKTNRDEVLMVSRNHAAEFSIVKSHPWKVATCPMSSASFSEGISGVLAAWETAGSVYFSHVNPKTLETGDPITPSGNAKRKHPVSASNSRGEILLAWTEGTGWQQGGSLAWQLFDSSGRARKSGRTAGVPMWSLVAVVPGADGDFTIFY